MLGPPFDHARDEQGPSELERHGQPLMVDERLRAGGPGALDVAVNGCEMGAAARSRWPAPTGARATSRVPQAPARATVRDRLTNRRQRFDRVGDEPDDSRFAQSERSDRLGEPV